MDIHCLCNNELKQAGLSRATLEISYEFSSSFPLRTHKSRSIQWLLRYSTFNILRLSSIGGHLPLEVVFHWRLSSIGGRLLLEFLFHWRLSSIGGRLPLEVVFHWRSSSIGGRLPLEIVFHWRLSCIGGCLPLEVIFHWRSSSFTIYNVVWSSKLKFKI